MKFLFSIVLIVMSLAAVKSQACSDMGFFLAQPAPFFQTGGNLTDTFNLVVNANTTQGACNYFLTFDYGSSNSYTTRSLKTGSAEWPYQFSSDAGGLSVLKKLPDATSCANLLCGKLQGNVFYNTASHSYTLTIDDSNDWRTAGVYFDIVRVSLYQGNPNNPTLVITKTLLLTAQANRRADISVVSSGGSFDINKTTHTVDFTNALTTGAQGTADIIVKYNAGFSLYAWTDNGQKLKQTNGNDTIDYTFKISGTTVAIPFWTMIATQSGTSPASGLVKPVVITIGNTTGKAQGTYTDTINLTIQSNQ
jgi:hypothetical protein